MRTNWFDTDRLKTGARSQRSRITELKKGNKKNSHRKVCAYLTCRLMGDPVSAPLPGAPGAGITIITVFFLSIFTSIGFVLFQFANSHRSAAIPSLSKTSYVVSRGSLQMNSVFRTRQSIFLTWSARTTPPSLPPQSLFILRGRFCCAGEVSDEMIFSRVRASH